jgi:hypothetical protein
MSAAVCLSGWYSMTVAPSLPRFFGTYVEVEPYSRLAWTNEEGGDGGRSQR